MKLSNRHRVVIITGGTSGIGRGVATVFAREGWRVGLISRSEAGLAAVALALDGGDSRITTAQADVSNSDELRRAAATIVAELGAPDIWINCAGNGVYGQFASVPEAEFEHVTAVTYGGTVNGCRTALAMMAPRGAGTIVNVCSAAAFHGLPLMTAYTGAKAAVRGFSQALQAELKIEGSRVRIVTIFPPAVNTPFFSHAISHMPWPARPAPPVYQPEVIAAGIHLAAMRGDAEAILTSTAVMFSIIQRISPSFTAFLMSRMGFDRQLTRDSNAIGLTAPTLFAPLQRESPTRGPFGRRARNSSMQVWLSRHRQAAAAVAVSLLIGMLVIGSTANMWRHAPAQQVLGHIQVDLPLRAAAFSHTPP